MTMPMTRSRGTSPQIDALTGRRSTRGADDRYERLERPCPTCGALGVRIVYGYPSGALRAAARAGQVELGGCTYCSVTHHCPNGHEWEQVVS